jgi:DNA ligase 1
MLPNFKPMLSATLDTPTFPYLASPKLDGIRCVVVEGVALSRTLKPIPNKHIQSILGSILLSGLDGEIICGDPTDSECFRNTTTVVMSHDKVADFTFRIFDDYYHHKLPFSTRLKIVEDKVSSIQGGPSIEGKHIVIVPHTYIETQEEFDDKEVEFLTLGYEGMMVRNPDGHYKFGRATARENILSKVKRFADSEAEVVGIEELMHNENEKSVNELGRSKRSSHQEGKRPAGTMGALVVRDIETGIEFNIGTGFDAAQRDEIWENRNSIIGKILTYKSFHIGVKEKPRHPVFKFWRTIGF